MLPGLDFSEVLVIAVIALLVVGPRDLPLMLRKLGRFMARLRGMANEFRAGFDELARQAELDELKREVDALRRGDILTKLDRDLTAPLLAPPPPPIPDEDPIPAPPEAPPAPPGPDIPQPPTVDPPPAPPEVPPISPPAPSGPEPVQAGVMGGRM